MGVKDAVTKAYLHDMLLADEEILEHVPNYPIHLIAPSEISAIFLA